MAELRGLFMLLGLVALSIAEPQHDFEAKNKAHKALAAQKESKASSANPGFDKAAFQKLSRGLNNTERHRNRGKASFSNLSIIHKLNQRHKTEQPDHNMMNDNEGFPINEKVDTNDTTLASKIKQLRRNGILDDYEYINKNTVVPLVAGVYCDFESRQNSSGVDMCLWQWNSTVSNYGLGFRVMTAADVVKMNASSKDLRFSGPTHDADGNVGGHFLYLPVDPTMENMVIKSPPFRGLWEDCKFEVYLHQSKMANASIRLISEATLTEVQLVLLEITGDNNQMWRPMRFTIGKVLQEVHIMVEISRSRGGAGAAPVSPLPHIALDDIRMLECLPEPAVPGGECRDAHIMCRIMNKESCIKQHQVCDLVRDCDDGTDEHQNCDKMPYGSYCNFESDDCGFENVPQPILKWSRHSGPTPTDKTGPNYDHTCGPPALQPAPAVPPLSPARANLTLGHCVGYYMLVNMNVTGPNKEKADFASTATMNSLLFNPPPTVHGNLTSKYYNCCMIRFYYQQNGRNYGSLSLDVVELTELGNVTTALWFSTKDKGEVWFKADIFLPNITRKYFLQFKTRMGMRIYSDSAIDDFSLTPECFGLNIPPHELGDYNYYEPQFERNTTPHPDFKDAPYYQFSSCGAEGRLGPNQSMCDAAYGPAVVTVAQNPPFQGIQAWSVPAEGIYTIIASGASGGLGAAGSGVSHAAAVRGVFELHRGEQLYMLVGQRGGDACKKTLSASDSPDCTPAAISSTSYTSKTHELRNTRVTDGGGGGGGATFVFLMDTKGQAMPLLVAGGGGGVSTGAFRDDGSQNARALTNATPEAGYMYGRPGETSGAGGGWQTRLGPVTPGFELVMGGSLLQGGAGGRACYGPAHGGFGGGGGGCLRGGGGGGWRGGDTNYGSNGGGGWSYMDQSRAVTQLAAVTVAPHMNMGRVLVIPALHACNCDYRCVALNPFRSEVRCYCPSTWTADAQDPTKCIHVDGNEWPRFSWFVIVVLSTIVFFCVLAILCVCLYMYNVYQRKKETEVEIKRAAEQEQQLQRLRGAPGGNDAALAAFNLNYGCDGMLPQGMDVRGLPQVSRESLKLVKALGQGAFGEVYQGLYRHRTRDTVEMPVAVKTLPELSTGLAEAEFLMEAAIMAKFNHPNVVHLIGVCFDRHPRFIVLELLAGGDLKNFLRESRPRPERASALTMKDLLLCAVDICKGCRYLELQRFLHRDIAARNCLLTSRGPGRVVKIADFGMARDIYRAEYYKKGGKAMLPIKWMPPEAYIDGVFSIKTDVWSFGVLLWEVFSLGVMPYTGCSNREVMDMVSGGGRLERPYGCPLEIYKLMCDCWNPQAHARPSFVQMFERLTLIVQDPEIVSALLPVLRSLPNLPPLAHTRPTFDPEIVSAPLPVLRSLLNLPPPVDHSKSNGVVRAPPCDYLVPMSPSVAASPDSPTTSPYSKSLTPDQQESEDLQYQHRLKVLQGYGNIVAVRGAPSAVAGEPTSICLPNVPTKFQTSNSTDRLLSTAEEPAEDYPVSEAEGRPPVIWETSFIEKPDAGQTSKGPAVDKLISITPTSPKPPENALSLAMDPGVVDKTAPIASPDPPRIAAWGDPPRPTPKPKPPKPLCLDAAQLEQNLHALKKNSGSVNLNTMNILPPYINVVTPNKLSESKTIQIDPKKAVIHDLQSPKEDAKPEEGKLKTSASAASLIEGPMTDVPYADSDNTSSSSSGRPPSHIQNQQKSKQNNYTEVAIGKDRGKLAKQGSNGVNDSEISC